MPARVAHATDGGRALRDAREVAAAGAPPSADSCGWRDGRIGGAAARAALHRLACGLRASQRDTAALPHGVLPDAAAPHSLRGAHAYAS